VRQRREPAARACRGTAARDCGPCGPRRKRPSRDAPAAHRKPRPDRRCHGARSRTGVRGCAVRGLVESSERSARGRRAPRHDRPRLHGDRRRDYQHRVQPRSRLAGAASRSDRVPEGRRAGCVERRGAPAVSQRPGGVRDGTRGRPAGGCGPDAAKPVVTPARAARARSVTRADDAAVTAPEQL
jgi:hypothetical protein